MPALQSKSNPQYLVVDDELLKESQRKAFVRPLRLPIEAGIFVETYEEALEVLESNSSIILCFIDIRIPLNKQEMYEKDDGEIKQWTELAQEKIALKKEYGTKLLQQIRNKQIENMDIYVYSAYVRESTLQQIFGQFQDIVKNFFSKTKQSALETRIKHYSELFSLKTSTSTVSTVSTPSKSFDYSFLDSETSSFVQSRTIEIRRLTKRAAQDLIDVGKYLMEVKEKLGYGHFYNWLEAEFEWSPSTATRMVRVAQRFSSVSLNDLKILPSALYELASPSAPEEAITELFERARQGETITEKMAKAVKAHYKAQKKRETFQPKKVEQTETGWNTVNVDSVSKSSSSLPEKKEKAKHEILGVVPSQKAIKNSWWQLGEHHRLFCGEPKNKEFLKRLPKNIALMTNFLPKNDPSLIPMIESNSALTFYSKHKDLDLDSLIRDSLETSTKVKDIVVFNYIYDVGLLELVEGLDCYFWLAEPDLEKCERILTRWREKGSVMRIKN